MPLMFTDSEAVIRVITKAGNQLAEDLHRTLAVKADPQRRETLLPRLAIRLRTAETKRLNPLEASIGNGLRDDKVEVLHENLLLRVTDQAARNPEEHK